MMFDSNFYLLEKLSEIDLGAYKQLKNISFQFLIRTLITTASGETPSTFNLQYVQYVPFHEPEATWT